MGRLKAFDETRALDAAVDCFWSRGYEATSIRDLADAMKIGGTSLYNAYGDKRALFAESREWYALYGVSMRPCPETYEEFLEYWDHMCRNVLVDHPAARTVLDISELPPPPWMSWMPRPIWRAQVKPVQRFFMWITTGLYDEPVRDLLGLSWSERDEKWLRRFGRAVNAAMRLVPERYRWHPRARDGWDRARGRVAMDAPILETPTRNLPPADKQHLPRHYCPVHAERRADLPWQG